MISPEVKEVLNRLKTVGIEREYYTVHKTNTKDKEYNNRYPVSLCFFRGSKYLIQFIPAILKANIAVCADMKEDGTLAYFSFYPSSFLYCKAGKLTKYHRSKADRLVDADFKLGYSYKDCYEVVEDVEAFLKELN